MTGQLILSIATFVFVAALYKQMKDMQESMRLTVNLLIEKENKIKQLTQDVEDFRAERDFIVKTLEEQKTTDEYLEKQLAVYKELAEQAEVEAYKQAIQDEPKKMLF